MKRVEKGVYHDNSFGHTVLPGTIYPFTKVLLPPILRLTVCSRHIDDVACRNVTEVLPRFADRLFVFTL